MSIRTIFLVFLFSSLCVAEERYCSKAYGCSGDISLGKTTRYILYDVNVGEGFNLKRDVYIRMAVFMHTFAKKSKIDWHLVLPPWTKQWHWRAEKLETSYPWRNFFNVESMQLYSPVIELDQFYIDFGDTVDEVYILQHFPEFYEWTSDSKSMDWSDKWKYTECRDSPYWEQEDGVLLFLRGKKHVKANQVKCISFQGSSGFLESVVTSTEARSIMFDRAEITTHERYGDVEYWMCRRSMRFAKHLVDAASVFRKSVLNSSDEQDGTLRPLDWREEHPHRSAKGGPYLGVHLRRQDFVYGRPKEIPSLLDSALQIKKYLDHLHLTNVFVATDMAADEYEYLRQTLENYGYKSVRYEIIGNENNEFSEGELAVIDQIISSHAQFFVGTHESTFTYRIQEEREIMGFPIDATFNRFCPSLDSKDCTPPSHWLIKYPEISPKSFAYKESRHLETDEL